MRLERLGRLRKVGEAVEAVGGPQLSGFSCHCSILGIMRDVCALHFKFGISTSIIDCNIYYSESWLILTVVFDY